MLGARGKALWRGEGSRPIGSRVKRLAQGELMSSDIAYDKAVEVVTVTVRQETHKEDIRLGKEAKKWVLSPERKASQKEREYAAARMDGIVVKIKNAMQSALTKI